MSPPGQDVATAYSGACWGAPGSDSAAKNRLKVRRWYHAIMQDDVAGCSAISVQDITSSLSTFSTSFVGLLSASCFCQVPLQSWMEPIAGGYQKSASPYVGSFPSNVDQTRHGPVGSCQLLPIALQQPIACSQLSHLDGRMVILPGIFQCATSLLSHRDPSVVISLPHKSNASCMSPSTAKRSAVQQSCIGLHRFISSLVR